MTDVLNKLYNEESYTKNRKETRGIIHAFNYELLP